MKMRSTFHSPRRYAAIRWVALLGAISLLLAACGGGGSTGEGSSPGGSGETTGAASGLSGEIPVGVHWCLTGAAAYAGEPLLRGTELAVKEINETGFLGEATIKPVVEDDGSDPAQAVSITERLVNQSNVVGIVGGCTSAATIAAVEVAQDEGVPWVVANAVAPDIASIGDYIFRTSMPYTPIFEQIVAEVMPAKDAQTVALVHASDNPSLVSFADDYRKFMTEAGYEIVIDESIASSEEQDFSSILTKISEQDPDVLLPMMLGPQAANFVLQARRQGSDAETLGQQGHNTAEMFDIAGEAMVGHIVPSTWFITESNPRNQHFIDLFREEHGEDPSFFDANGYTGMWLLAEAIKEAGEADRDAIQQALAGIDEVDVPLGDGKMTFDEEGEGTQVGVILEIGPEGEFRIWEP